MGNRLRHAYDHIDTKVIWGVVSRQLEGLMADASAALDRLAETP